MRVFDPVAGGEALLVIDVARGVCAGVLRGPGDGRAAARLWHEAPKKVRVFDPVAGGEALVVIDVGSEVHALAVFADPATGAPRLACGRGGCCRKKVRIYGDPVAGGEALVVLEGHTGRCVALTVFEDPATGGLRLASGSDATVPCASGTWPRAARRCSCSRDTQARSRADGLRGPGDGRDAARERVG